MTARELILWILEHIDSFDDVLPISIERRADERPSERLLECVQELKERLSKI